jgi:hypothetical protein
MPIKQRNLAGKYGLSILGFLRLSKILLVGENLRNDAFEKSEDYKHQLTFISNTEIELKYSPSKALKKEGITEQILRINEQNSICAYDELHKNIQNKIEESYRYL